jgi:tetratricopeptide (TPR) repeat protein
MAAVPFAALLTVMSAAPPAATPILAAAPAAKAADPPAPIFPGMGAHHRAVGTARPEAQRYFDQGLTWAFAFNHDEAIRSFKEAARIDPKLAMAWWGVALCNGPHINNPAMDETRSREAWRALKKAESLAAGAGPVEKALIRALGRRYAHPPPADRAPLDRAYADAMREVWKAHPDDADVGVLFAEAMMDLRPWDLWRDGAPQPGTEELVGVLERVMAMAPDHPGALHLYIHAVEESSDPGRAVAASDRLRSLVPASGHLVHMPSHIDTLVGRWAEAVESNQRAIASDRAYRARSPRQSFYRVYMAHNHHMLAYAAMMDGQSAVALQAAREMVASIPEDYVRDNAPLVDGMLPTPIEVLMRFGRWEEVLAEPRPADFLPVSNAIRHFARGAAFAATGRIAEAEAEQKAFEAAWEKIPEEAVITFNPARKVLLIARDMLAGEIAFRRGRSDEAVRLLRAAVEKEDGLDYMEPPDWIQPVRHSLGAVLLELGRAEEAEAVYREDLRRRPGNGWSLYGLARALRLRGAGEAADQVAARFERAWARADVRITASCLCLQGG